MTKYTIIAPWGDQMDNLFPGIKDFPTEKIILVVPEKSKAEALKFKEGIDKFRIPVQIRTITGNVWEETFKAVAEIRAHEGDSNLIVNVATGDRMTRCAATSAAFVNGLKAFGVEGDQTMLLPVLKFSYYRVLSDKKMDILKYLNKYPEGITLDRVCKDVKMSLPLLSYHLNGNLKSEGLKDLGLIDVEDQKGRSRVKLSMQGRLLIKGYIS